MLSDHFTRERVYICSAGVFGSMFQFPFSVFVAAGLAGVSVLYISVHTNEIKKP